MARDVVVFPHLRWTWGWQRPQHLVPRRVAGYVDVVDEQLDQSEPDRELRPLLRADHWDTIASAVEQLVGARAGIVELSDAEAEVSA